VVRNRAGSAISSTIVAGLRYRKKLMYHGKNTGAKQMIVKPNQLPMSGHLILVEVQLHSLVVDSSAATRTYSYDPVTSPSECNSLICF
jgi:hypothetical protein